MSAPIVIVPKYARLGQGFSQAERIKSYEHPGRRTLARGYQSPASWISDLADARNGILLCEFCIPHFNPRKNRYRKRFVPDQTFSTRGMAAAGKCDACKQETVRGTFLVAEELHDLVSMDPSEARRLARHRREYAEKMWRRKKIVAEYRDNPFKFGSKRTTIPMSDKRRIAT